MRVKWNENRLELFRNLQLVCARSHSRIAEVALCLVPRSADFGPLPVEVQLCFQR